MTHSDFIRFVAHFAASEYAKHGLAAPEAALTTMAVLEDAGVRIVVTLGRYDGPPRLYLTPQGAEFLGMPQIPTTATITPPAPKLTPAQQRLLDVMTNRPAKAETLAARLKYRKCYGSFRERCASLVKLGLATHDDDGYARV